jgi:HlyD family secretion protein
MKKFSIYLSLTLPLGLIACLEDSRLIDATGVFEATEIIVSAESGGRVLSLDISEGDELKKATPVGQIDSTQLHLFKLQLQASKIAVLSGRPDIHSQVEATEREIAKWEREKKRVKNLLAGDVATQKQLDDINAQLAILESQLNAQKISLSTNVSSIDAQSETIEIQVQQLIDQLERSVIKSPIDGTVLVKYAEAGEITASGKALFKIADMDRMILRAFVTADQLAPLKIGQSVQVFAEFGKSETRSYQGRINWISAQSEFTPKTIKTQDERANLVYAIKVAVENDGLLKIGMYGGVNFSQE